MKRFDFYLYQLNIWVKEKDATVLVVGGGPADAEIFNKLKFTNVTISNISISQPAGNMNYRWEIQDAHRLTYEDGSFDYTVVHAALHHCQSPHTALLEMYRVARKGVIAFEARDSMLMRFLEKINLAPVYEHSAVVSRNMVSGGMNDSEIPNFIYRWTEREIEKIISSYNPLFKHTFKYAYANEFYSALFTAKAWQLILIKSLEPFYNVFSKLFQKQQNLFAFMIKKPNDLTNLHPWLENTNGAIKFNKTWGKHTYKNLLKGND
jgi:ubiquinone/menaquinone biosynthesis C-methylase UbiE